ncbi:hypothetical protein [Polyangium spumosum]|uniref:Uncharacterized protein n=1 Tax=Polyangium spumosum TaxID=889282 RepID=A0A6N7PYI3_9BACT|nr:hypothetical protein [Polyangium spumosum]MRG97138.1 hypothetical protein [Polyangium spumosum]
MTSARENLDRMFRGIDGVSGVRRDALYLADLYRSFLPFRLIERPLQQQRAKRFVACSGHPEPS